MNNSVYNPYNMGQQNINQQQQDYYGPGFYQHQQQPIRYENVPPMNMGGMYNQGFGNTGVTGSGSMGGYYGQVPGGGYYNPYLAQKKREQEIKEAQERQQFQSNIMKRLSKNSHVAQGIYSEDEFQEHSSQYDPIWYDSEEYLMRSEIDNLYRIHEMSKSQPNMSRSEVQLIHGIDRVNKEIDKKNKKFGLTDDMSMMEFFDVAGDILLEQRISETQRNKRDMGKLYDSDGYGKLIDIHSGKHNYFNSIHDSNNLGRMKHHNIDDMEVTLPSNMDDQYTKRKNAFINQLLNGE